MHRQGRLGEAEQHYRAVLQSCRDHPDALQRLALIFFHTRRLAEAAESYERLIAVVPGDAVAYSNLGQILSSMGRNEEALPHLERAVALRPDLAEAHTNLGNVLAQLNRPEDALTSYEEAVALNSRLAEPHNNIGMVLMSLGRYDDAIPEFEKALALNPGFAFASNNLGEAMSKLGRYEQAVAYFERTLTLQPNSALASKGLGLALARLDRHEEAVAQFRKVLAGRPDDPVLLNNLGHSLNATGLSAEALSIFERLIAIDPNVEFFHYGAGNALLFLGRLNDTCRAFERAVALAPHVPAFHRALANAKRFREDDPQLPIMEEMARNVMVFPDHEQINLHFALAKAYDDVGRRSLAFEQLTNGNFLKRGKVDYDEATQVGVLRGTAAAFTPEVMGTKSGGGNPSEVPVFVMGMPRSGTTLVEQILASHPDVFGAGELQDFSRAVHGEGLDTVLPAGAGKLTGDDLRRLGERYLAQILLKSPETKRIVDKMPGNFCCVGLIHLALPKARIIHVQRDPLATCFSCYATLFTSNVNYTYDLGELGRYYKAYEALMAHWRAVLPEGAMLEVQYETLVENFETEVRRIIDYCGLDWDERCLAFYEAQRPVQTASAVQVRQPLYRSSIGRWRPYKEYLRPLLDALELGSD